MLKKMKCKKIVIKVINVTLFTFYLVICLVFASGVNVTAKNSNEDSIGADENITSLYKHFFDDPWEVIETTCLFWLFINNGINLIVRKKKSALAFISLIVISCLFILNMIVQYVEGVYTKPAAVIIGQGFLRMLILYLTFLFNFIEKRSIGKLFYRNYANENYSQELNETITTTRGKDIKEIPMTDKNKQEEEIVILNNISPIKVNTLKSPRRISIKNEVQNKLPLLLVEKVKIPKFLDEDSEEESHELNNSDDTHAQASFIDEIALIYQNNKGMNDKYGDVISELNRIPDIIFNVFKLSTFSGGNELTVVMCHLMHLCNFSESLKIDKRHYNNYFYHVNKIYRKNPYHNSIHGCDVTQTLYFLIKTCNIESSCNLSDIELFSGFFACAIHDLDHPGNNNNYEIAVGSTLAISYNDKAVLENYHLCKAFSLLRKPEMNVYENFSRSEYNISRAIIINMVLSTDMANHFLDLALTKNRAKSSDFNLEGADKQLMLNQLIHAADISNPMKPLDIYKEWVKRVFVEFFNQGDKERERGLKISYLCDRHTVNIIESQIGFIDNIVFPLFDTLSVAFPNIKMIVNLIQTNKDEFKKMLEKGEKIMLD